MLWKQSFLHPIFNSQNSIASMRQHHELHEELKKIWLFVYDFWKFYDSIYLHATLVWTFAMLLTGVKNWLFFNSVDILFWEIFQFCAQLCSHTACSLLIILQGALRKQSFFYTIFNSQNNIASMRWYPELKCPSWILYPWGWLHIHFEIVDTIFVNGVVFLLSVSGYGNDDTNRERSNT